ncbi:MAG: Lipopolysaccharide modification acyltransferase [Acidimicrobiales bacterium]|nr:Lipopolysaccharide modification acyltransferase [Acidimicrobiales bacterium]
MDGGSRRTNYFPALDGLRTMAVLAVVLFHVGVARAQGGFLGVSLFFTLSGYLITTLLLAERAKNGRIALGAFWTRRVRRLAPAALLCLAAILATSRWLVSSVEMRTLRGDMVAAAANVANWRFVTAGQSYAALFVGRPSPLLHFWSLAIEEQFYLVFPCVIALLLAARRRWAVPVGLAALTVGSLIASLASSDHDLVYYGTHTRAGELLIGALLAWWLSVHPASASANARRDRLLGLAALVAVAGFAALVVMVDQSDEWLYRGGFVALALLWCPMIVAAGRSSGAFAAILGWSPFAALGRRSYGIYVFHWPVLVLVTPSVLHLHGWVARTAQIALVAVLTEVCFRSVERPIRDGRLLQRAGVIRLASLAAVAAVIAVALVVPAAPVARGQQISMLDAPDRPVLFDGAVPSRPNVADASQPAANRPLAVGVAPSAALAPLNVTTASTTTAGTTASTTAGVQPTTVKIVVVGSSMPVMRAVQRAAAGQSGVRLVDDVLPGCAIVAFDDAWPLDPSCLTPPLGVPQADVLIVAIGPADHAAFADRVAAVHGWPVAAQYSISEYLDGLGVSAFGALARHASRVILVDEQPVAGDFLDGVLAEVAVSTEAVSRRAVNDVDRGFVDDLLAPPRSAATLNVMVIGDSTSYGVATGLAGSAEDVRVLWAGRRNCALVPLDASTLLGSETSAADCPGVHSGWPEAIASFHPDVVLAVDSLPEEARQRYPGNTEWSEPGDGGYVAAHDAAMRDLIALVAPTGAVVEVASAPPNPSGGQNGWTTDDGIAAWNAQIARWDRQWGPVQTIDYGALVANAEAAAGHSLRPDGAHLDDGSVQTIVGGSLAPLLVHQVAALRASLVASGCLVLGGRGAMLDLTKCG